MIRAFFKLISANVVQQLGAFLLVPVVTRLYGPDSYGMVAVLVGYAMILSVVVNFRLDQAILIPKTVDESLQLYLVCIKLSLVGLVLAIPLIFFESLLEEKYRFFLEFGSTIYWLPVLVFLLSLSNCTTSFYTKIEKYSAIATITVVSGLLIPINRIFLAYINEPSTASLLLGYILALGIALLLYQNDIIAFIKSAKLKSSESIASTIRTYSDFPRYALPSALLNRLGKNLPVLMFGYYGSFEVAAFFSIAFRLIGAPMQLCSNALRRAVVTGLNDKYKNGQRFYRILLKYIVMLTGVLLIPLLLFSLFSDQIVSMFLGPKWEGAGIYFLILIPFFVLDVVQNISSVAFLILRRQRLQMYLQGFALVIVGFALVWANVYALDGVNSAIVFSIVASFASLPTIIASMLCAYRENSCQTKVNKDQG